MRASGLDRLVRRAQRTALGIAAIGLATAAVAAPAAAAVPPPDSTDDVSIFAIRRDLAIDAARVRLTLHVREHPADPVGAPVACPLASPDVMGNAAAAASSAMALDLRFQLDPWSALTTSESELRPSWAPAGATAGTPVVVCSTQRPADGSLTRPTLSALQLGSGVSFGDVARLYGIEPILPVRPAAVGGQLAGSCLASAHTGVCVALWQSRNLALVVTLDGPPAAVNPSTPGSLVTSAVPGIVDGLAVIRTTPLSCDLAVIQADTGIALQADPGCSDGWAVGASAPCPETGCTIVEAFHVTAGGWVHVGSVDTSCAENFAALGMTGVTAQKIAPACDADAFALRRGTIRAGQIGRRVRALQVALVGRGYDLPVDGRYGPLTESAVVDYQVRNALVVDGIAGSQTQRSLGI